MPERSYENYPVESAFKMISSIGKEFGNNKDMNQYSEQYVKYLIQHEKKFNVSIN